MKQVIKYAALLFALVLAAAIIGGCLSLGVSLVQGFQDEMSYRDELDNEENNGIWYRDDDGNVVFLGIHFGSNEDVKSGSESFIASELDSLILEGISGELIIDTWDNDSVSVVYENISENYEIYTDDGTLIIEREGSFFSWGTAFTETPKIHVSVPADMTWKEVEIDKGSGSAKISGLLADNFVLDNGSGGVGISDITATKFHVDSGSGSVTISGVVAEKTVFYSGSGSFNVKNSVLGETSMDTGSGFVNFEEVTASNLVVDSGSGRVDVTGYLTGNCVFESGSGSLNVEIYGKEEDYNIRTDMGSGSFYLNGDKEKDTRIEHNGAEHLLVFDAGSGRVSVEFRKATESIPSEAPQENGENYDR